MVKRLRLLPNRLLPHLLLLPALLLVVVPVILIIMNSFKRSDSIFSNPFQLPLGEAFDPTGYQMVFNEAPFGRYFANSIIVTLVSMFFILFLGSMASYALAEYRFRGNGIISLYLALGIMVSIRLGSVGIVRMMVAMGLMNTLWALILVYIASGLPLTTFIMTQFMRQVPHELKDAARIDGANEYQVYWLILPLVRPAIATVAVFSIIPIWNDLWFPIILAPAALQRTVTFGIQQFFGEFKRDWQAILAALTLAMVPVLVLYAIISRQLLRGLTSGAFK
jgi:raffinose/stachyose/melibiose transport system permease protein